MRIFDDDDIDDDEREVCPMCGRNKVGPGDELCTPCASSSDGGETFDPDEEAVYLG